MTACFVIASIGSGLITHYICAGISALLAATYLVLLIRTYLWEVKAAALWEASVRSAWLLQLTDEAVEE